MTSIISKYSLTLWMACLCGTTDSAIAQSEKPLPIWKASVDDVAKLGKEFSDAKITIRPPANLQKVELETSPEMEKAGVSAYGWTPGGVFPSAENLSIALTPFAKPSSDALDKMIAGMKKSFERNSESIEFGEVKRGNYQGVECRYGTYTAQISKKKIRGFYLVGIDKIGTFAISSMIPSADASPDEVRLLKTSMLTFKRKE